MAIINPNAARSQWVTYGKAVTTSRTTTTSSTADPDLQCTVIASATYLWRFYVQFLSGAGGGYRYKFTLPSSSSFFATRYSLDNTTLSSAVNPTMTADVTMPGSTNGALLISGVYVVGVTGGTFSFDWAQNASDGTNTSTLRGSYLELCRLL